MSTRDLNRRIAALEGAGVSGKLSVWKQIGPDLAEGPDGTRCAIDEVPDGPGVTVLVRRFSFDEAWTGSHSGGEQLQGGH